MWRATKELLKGLSVHPMVEAFRSVPRDLFANRWPSRGPRLIHLQHVVNAYAGLKEALKPAPAGAPAITAADVLRSIQPGADDLQIELDRLDESKSLDTCLARDLAGSSSQPLSIPSSTTWAEVARRMESVLPRLTTFWRTRTPPDAVNENPDSRHRWQRDAEVFLAIPVALMIRELMARVVRGLYVSIGVVVLLGVYTIAIPVYPHRALFAVTWLYVFVAVATTMMTILSAERDVVLSRLAGTSPGRIEWDAAFFKRTILPVVIVLLTLFAMQFPEAGSAILRWVRPVQIALP